MAAAMTVSTTRTLVTGASSWPLLSDDDAGEDRARLRGALRPNQDLDRRVGGEEVEERPEVSGPGEALDPRGREGPEQRLDGVGPVQRPDGDHRRPCAPRPPLASDVGD